MSGDPFTMASCEDAYDADGNLRARIGEYIDPGTTECDGTKDEATASPVPEVPLVPHPGESVRSVELDEILDEVDRLLAKYVAWPCDEARHAVVAWAVHTWCADSVEVTPRLCVLSPEKGSGKTRVLELLHLVCRAAELVLNLSPSSLFRMIDAGPITLLMDEADTYLGPRVAPQHEELRGLVNAGYRRGATVPRVNMKAKPGEQVERFSAFCPVALAGIGDLPDTITDRAVIVSMKRRAPGERIESFRMRRAENETADLRDRLADWSSREGHLIGEYEPELPDVIVDRLADVWEGLIAIGDHAGSEWSKRIRTAALVLTRQRQRRDPTLGVRLLADCRTVFGDRLKLSSVDLIARLVELEEAPWASLRGEPLDARGLAKLLRPFEIGSKKIRIDPRPALPTRGYERADFEDAWRRYLTLAPEHAEHAEPAEPGSSEETRLVP